MYKLLLILKYLRKRRIAWVSLIAVTLCTALVLVVISVMGGWLRMFRQSFHGLSGDIQVTAIGTQGVSFYEQMIARIETLPYVGKGNAVPVVKSYGLLTFNTNTGVATQPVQVLGYPAEGIGNVNDFDQSLYRQYTLRKEAAAKLKDTKLHLTAEEKAYYERLANEKSRPNFDLVKDMSYPAMLPADWKFPDSLKSKVFYLPSEKRIVFRGEMSDAEYTQLLALSSQETYAEAITYLRDMSDPRRLYPNLKTADVRTWPGMIVGDGVVNIHRDADGSTVGRSRVMYRTAMKLTVLGMGMSEGAVDEKNKVEKRYWVVDDSRTKVHQFDSQTVYVPFDVLQNDLQLGAKAVEGSTPLPARTSEIDIKVKPGTDLNAARDKINEICTDVMKANIDPFGTSFTVQTWEDTNRTWLHAIENEKVLVTFLFSMISVVAVFLVFCIFYMIVVEKTRDIGIIKSVGATNAGVAWIFLGYGMAIGLVGAGLGFLFGWLVVHFINELHGWLGKAMGIVIWDPQVYLFDKIPNTMNPVEVTVILVVAVMSAVAGSLIPAYRAARLHPVDALRWE